MRILPVVLIIVITVSLIEAFWILSHHLSHSLAHMKKQAPLTVMVVIPTALIGVVIGHLLMGLDLTMPSMVGMASLFGVVVNDSILLVVFIRGERNEGASVTEAAKHAGRARFRPILLTSITTVAGLMSLLLEKSLQAQILIPLATSLASGLATATIAALFLVPAVYAILDDLGWLGALDAEPDEFEESVTARS